MGHELDMDLGLDDVDFLSVGHSKSASYPSIHFGNEDDASTAANSPVVSSRPVAVRGLSRAGSPVPPKYVRTLYIQVRHFFLPLCRLS